jgi:coproporphyrinogen III oxidase-like Fe-S oxidoreductase
MPPATSVFFGGGTPSMVPGGALMDVLDAIPRASRWCRTCWRRSVALTTRPT